MKQSMTRALATLLIIFICLSFVSCKKEEEKKPTEEEKTQETLAEEEVTQETPETAENEEDVQTSDILEFCQVREAMSGKGELTKKDSYKLFEINSEADLASYRHLFVDLTDEDAKTFTGNEGAKTVLVEIMGRQSNCTYAISAVEVSENTLSICIDETEEDVDQPEHTFLLLFIPDEYYNSEEISVLFTD